MITLAELNQFTGTEHYYRCATSPNVVYTDGVQYLAEHAKAYWLIDKIAALQRHKDIRADSMLNQHQFWTLDTIGNEATLTCERDTDNVAYQEKIDFTDFPLAQIQLWVAPADEKTMVIYLPSEH